MLLGIKRRENCEELSKTFEKYVFQENHSFFESASLKSQADLLKSKSESPTLLFLKETENNSLMVALCHEQPERIAHSRSFVKRDESDSVTVALF